MPRGRPSKFGDLDLKKVAAVARKGWTNAEMAEFFEVDQATWYRWQADREDFCEALKEWKVEADSRVERSLYERACGYSHPEDKVFCSDGEVTVVPTVKHYPPDPTAMIFWLKNRKGAEWNDKTEINHSGDLIALLSKHQK